MIMAGRPRLVVAILGYPNPYPKSLDATAKIAELARLSSTRFLHAPARWAQLPPALETIDQVFKKFNTTIANAVTPFAIARRPPASCT